MIVEKGSLLLDSVPLGAFAIVLSFSNECIFVAFKAWSKRIVGRNLRTGSMENWKSFSSKLLEEVHEWGKSAFGQQRRENATIEASL